MKLITRDTDYAIKALIFMAKKKDEITSVTELTHALKVPRPFLRKILQILTRHKILKSQKGQGGGFLLAKAIERIYVINLIEIFQGPIKINECLLKKGICPDVFTCVLRKRIEKIEDHVVSELKSISLESLLHEVH